MAEFDFDLFTIGAGSGGVAASRRAASYGAKVAICEGSRVGGTCVIRGCVPKKLLVYAAQFRDGFEDARGYGWDSHLPAFDWETLIARKDAEIDRLNGIYINMLKNSGVTLFEGFGRIVDPHTIEVAGKRYTARNILIATGGWPSMPAIEGIELAATSNEALHLPTLPHSVLIIGGGYIAVEFASIFRGLGAEVTLMIRGDDLLNGFDDDIRVALAQEMRKRGITIISRCKPQKLEKGPGGYTLTDHMGREHSAALVMAATGRSPNTKNLGLEEVGITLNDKGAIPVDEWSRTGVEGIYAIGDVTDRMALTPIAIAEGRALAETLFNDNPMHIGYDNVPTAVFSLPPLGTVGLTEMQARAKYPKIDIYKAGFRPMKHTLSGRDERVLMKLVVDGDSQRVLGAHMMGMDAPEMMQTMAIALNVGATKQDFDRTIALHPSTAEEFVLMREKAQPEQKI
ncbi:glutathione-disulfide reductase [Azospirillum picis]|uniref:Glutathione reductase n=1 Tax=Azospirillum picis TaxID=488438 RepID=A0ABU0MI83_9PROT|nr:glutathione-disulfide reductase [Azospirillum picis]MBP2299197.1 glutathione reductase (NADPH) [Azospirillum picis]MDQ0533165.1 glutathione reductase (NADPH) [Azospirillum picis]